MPDQSSRWFPTKQQVSENPEMVFRQVLTQQYALQDQHNNLAKKVSSPPVPATNAFPPGSGPTDTFICGLPVLPIDVQQLANGATLKFNKSAGLFFFG